MFEDLSRFDERANQVLALAEDEAQRFNHNYIGTEHLLLGLTRQEEGIAADVLHEVAIDIAKVGSAVEFIIGRGERMVMGAIGLTPRAKKVLELARDESRRLGHDYVGSEHILLGLIREGEGIAAGVLESLGVNLERLRSAVMRVLSRPGDAGADTTHQARELKGTSWEYLVIPVLPNGDEVIVQSLPAPVLEVPGLQGSRIESALSLLGDAGWALVAIDPRHATAGQRGSVYIFKRPK